MNRSQNLTDLSEFISLGAIIKFLVQTFFSKVVMWHIIRMRHSWIFRWNHFWCEKIVLGPPSGKNQNFWKIFWWRHNPVRSPKLAKNIIIQLIEWNLYQKRQNQYAFAILKLKNCWSEFQARPTLSKFLLYFFCF